MMATVVALCALTILTGGSPRPWEALSFPPLPPIPMPRVHEATLDNGLVLMVVEDRDLPLVDFTLYLKAGKVWDPPDKAGLAEITAEVLRTGGSQAFPGDQLDEWLEFIGAKLEVQCERDLVALKASCLAEHAQEVASRMVDLLVRPLMPEDKLELAKVAQRTAIASRNDDPMDMAVREFMKVVYGPTSPYATHPEYATIEAITREDLLAFHRRFYRPQGAVLVAVGDFPAKPMQRFLKRLLGSWPASQESLPPLPPVPQLQPRGIYYAHKADVTQSTILLGHTGFRADDPDYPAMALLDHILGQGFSSRIMNEVRTKRGLAYVANSLPGYGFARPGILGAYAGTKTESTLVSIRVIEAEIRRVTQEPVTQEELERARNAILNSMVFTYDSPSKLATRLAYLRFFGYPRDFLARYEQAIRNATAEDLLAAAQRKIHPDHLSVLVIGKRDEFAEPLETLGEVREIDVSIPPPPSRAPVSLPQAPRSEEARQLLSQAAQWAGGPRLVEVSAVSATWDATVFAQGMSIPLSITETKLLPDKLSRTQRSPFGEVVVVVSGEDGWVRDASGVRDLSPDLRAQVQIDLRRDFLWLLTHFHELDLWLLEPDSAQGLARILVGDGTVKDWVVLVDREGKLVGMEYQGTGPAGPAHLSERYEAFVQTQGVMLPSQVEIRRDGSPLMRLSARALEVNGEVDEALFQRPQ